MLQIKSNKSDKVAGWFSPSEEAQANMDRLARINAFQGAIHSLRQIANDPQVEQIIQQINALIKQ